MVAENAEAALNRLSGFTAFIKSCGQFAYEQTGNGAKRYVGWMFL
jgi:hypothetical protein